MTWKCQQNLAITKTQRSKTPILWYNKGNFLNGINQKCICHEFEININVKYLITAFNQIDFYSKIVTSLVIPLLNYRRLN